MARSQTSHYPRIESNHWATFCIFTFVRNTYSIGGLVVVIFLSMPIMAWSQESISGKVIDADTQEAIPGVHLLAFGKGVQGSSSNVDGQFILQRSSDIDSIRVSCIGYATEVLLPKIFLKGQLIVALHPFVTALHALTVKAKTPQQLIKEAVQAISTNYHTKPFQVRGFYREQIKTSSTYFSVAEAVFETQLFPGKNVDDRCQLKLIQGRRSETVKSSRIFEDYHPGGGPNYLMRNTIDVSVPEFMDESHFPEYVYDIDSITSYESRDVYKISFDQRDGLKKDLWSGTLFIDAESGAIIELNYALSEKGVAYRKHLSGKDQLMAGLLGINFEVLNKGQHYSYHRIGTSWSLHESWLKMEIHFTQPRKKIDEQFTFQAEMLALSEESGKLIPFSKDDQWHRSQLVKNLPGDFDEQFWGSDNYIQPEQSLTDAVKAMDVLRGTSLTAGIPSGWMFLHSAEAKAYQMDSAIVLKPYMESRWRDESQGPYLWKSISGDFTLDAHIKVTKATDSLSAPDAGFQIGGLMVRVEKGQPENYLLFGLGTMGSNALKLVSQNTINNNSAIHVSRTDSNDLYLRMTRSGTSFGLYYRLPREPEWKLLREVIRKDLPSSLQFGLAAYAYFPGNAPNRKPDILLKAQGLNLVPTVK